MNIFDFLKNYKLNKHPLLQEKIVDRFIQLIPKFLHQKVDRKLLVEDSYYAAWFTSRHCFLEAQRNARESALSHSNWKREYLLWAPVGDISTPKECLLHKRTIYHALDAEFIEYSVDHWMTINRGCRCSLIGFTESDVKKYVLGNKAVLSQSIRDRFAVELNEAKKLTKTFDQVAYDLVFGKFPHYHLYNPENWFSDDDEYLHLKESCLRELQIIVESLEIIKDTHYVDTAQSRLDLARSMRNAVFQKKELFSNTVFEAITAKLIIEFRKAHTCVYRNIFNKHIEKSKNVKRQATKEKYINLAVNAVETGLKDEFADTSALKELLLLLDNGDK